MKSNNYEAINVDDEGYPFEKSVHIENFPPFSSKHLFMRETQSNFAIIVRDK
ncbi:MAG: hypothetical protein IPL26_16045 [Leptospiraceae bacterium]|nr:hypothetical protein [Leptospiraceae bacterium]